MKARLLAWWDGLDDAERVQWTGVAGALFLYGIHWILWSPWLIEDSAITYAYARNAALGEGWVPFPGAEPVEGFSNPTWTALLTTLRVVGISPWLAAPILGLFLGASTIVLAFRWARELTGDRGLLPVVAPLWLAVSPFFVVWASSGLENPLFVWLLAVGALRFLHELRHGGAPWSALPMGLLAITRPEGPLYVAAMAFVGAGLSLRKPRNLARIGGFVALSAGVWFAWVGYRMAVFGWPLPNTYYAKLTTGRDHFRPWDWYGAVPNTGWLYLRNWSGWSTLGFLLPLFPLAATGWKGWRGQLGKFTALTLFLLLLPGAEWLTSTPIWVLAEEPETLVKLRVVVLFAVAFALPWAGLGRRADDARILAWTLAATTFAYVIYVGQDWMQGYRWLNYATVPLAVMLADLLATLVRARDWADPGQARLRLFAVVGAAPIAAGVVHTIFLLNPTEVSPFDVGRRVRYMEQVQERLHVDHLTLYDVDMGANMWWSGDRIVDVAGLIDVPIARHRYQPAFVREYLLRETRPEFMHAHGNWRRQMGLDTQPVFRRDWIRIPDYVAGVAYMHVGNHIRRDLIFQARWQGRPDEVRFANRVRLEGINTPSPVVPPGGTLYVEVGFRALRDRLPPFRPIVFLTDGERVHSWELPPAYDWVPTFQWRKGEVTHGRHSLTLPDDLPPGRWDLGVVLLDRAAGVLPADRAAEDPVFAKGEVRWLDRVEIAPEPAVLEQVDQALAQLSIEAEAGRCVAAEKALQRARHHLPADHPAQPWEDEAHHRTVARCWAEQATLLEPRAAEEAIRTARQWAHDDPEVARTGRELANAWEAEGDAAWAEGQPGRAYGAWRRTLAADPYRPRVRKRAEEARDIRLGFETP